MGKNSIHYSLHSLVPAAVVELDVREPEEGVALAADDEEPGRRGEERLRAGEAISDRAAC